MKPILELEQQEMISPDFLLLDVNNPRLFIGNEKQSQDELVKTLVDTADLKELIQSMAENGYIPIEPLIVVDDGENHFTVLEGNRRLAALRILTNPNLARKCRISVPKDLPKHVTDTFKEVAVYRVKSEDDARSLIGFKHVNGPHKWESFAKAQFAYKWYISEKDEGLTIEDIANKLGDKNNTVRSLVSAMFVLEQAKEQGVYDVVKDRTTSKFAYSHFYTALNRTEYKDFLGLDKDWNSNPGENPISPSRLENLKDVLIGLYGYKPEQRPAIIGSQNPDLKHFGEVINNAESLDVFKNAHTPLKELYALAGDPLKHIKDSFIRINQQLDTISTVLDRASYLDEATRSHIEQFRRKQSKISYQLQYLMNEDLSGDTGE
ncbi:ParB/Srx family N-terminal domain-containing protein [Photobacterium ganghwense]|uniref:ParB/Srx family N-terminal domain-containing protein n=1 Tax=Photobacterium ganghwense TaxID=320778 RepID=UPI001C2CF9BD|nr:ParB/Srx family N-terminal domain-containing protein [Photobacterium ganghwense]MBV1843385.1 ParB/Srx family N-terminal domain-containing protein [Photobacterium ganghwense]